MLTSCVALLVLAHPTWLAKHPSHCDSIRWAGTYRRSQQRGMRSNPITGKISSIFNDTPGGFVELKCGSEVVGEPCGEDSYVATDAYHPGDAPQGCNPALPCGSDDVMICSSLQWNPMEMDCIDGEELGHSRYHVKSVDQTCAVTAFWSLYTEFGAECTAENAPPKGNCQNVMSPRLFTRDDELPHGVTCS